MSETHVKYSIGTGSSNDDQNYAKQILFHIYTFVKSSGQTAVRFADNAEGTAVSLAGVSYGSPSAYSDFGNGGFVVIESATAMPSGNRWQCMFLINTGATPYFFFHFAPRGGWTPGGTPADPTQAATWSSNPVNLTAMKPWGYYSYIDEGARCLISASDLDTYGASSAPVEYIRINIWDPNDSEDNEFLNCIRVGGYIPTDPDVDTNPACVLAGSPQNPGNGNSYTWSDYNSNSRSYNFCIVPPDTDGSQTDLYTYGAGWVSSVFSRTASYAGQYNQYKTRRGSWVNMPVYLWDYDSAACVGYFGKYDMFCGYEGRSDATQDSSGQYIVVNSYVFRWNP